MPLCVPGYLVGVLLLVVILLIVIYVVEMFMYTLVSFLNSHCHVSNMGSNPPNYFVVMWFVV